MKKMFEKNNGRKRRNFNLNKHKALRTPDRIFRNNKSCLKQLIPETLINWNSMIIYGYHFLIKQNQMCSICNKALTYAKIL